jgi:hypothetical protein
MAADIAELGIRIATDGIRRGQDALEELARRGGQAERATNDLSDTVRSLGKGLAGLLGIVQALDFGSKIIQAQRDFDKLNASLTTATGSVGAAGKAFAALQAFAARTPYGLQDTTKAFIQLRNMGLTPTERALTSYGNTASGLGKDLSQMIEAVADATTGEFERLKEFGIKSKQEGDKVSLTFQGTTTKIGNNAKSIEEYLLRLGETKFAGAMELQANTLNGAISNLDDSWNMFLLSLAQTGAGDTAAAAVRGLSEALGYLGDQVKNGGPVINGLELAVKLTGAYLALLATPTVLAVFSGALGTIAMNLSLIKLEMRAGLGMWGLFNTSLTGTSVSAELAAGSLTKLKLSMSLLFAAFAGWEIGKYMDENFYQARIAGEVFVGEMLKGWETIKYGADVAWTVIKSGFTSAIGAVKGVFADFLSANAQALDMVGAKESAAGLREYSAELRGAAAAQMDLGVKLSLMSAGHAKAIELIDKETAARSAAAMIAAQVSEAGRAELGNVLKGIEAEGEAAKKTSKERAKAAQDSANWYKQTMEAGEDANAMYLAQLNAQGELTKEQENAIQVLRDLVKFSGNLSDAEKRNIAVMLESRITNERLTLARKADEKAMQDRADAIKRETDAAWGQVAALKQQAATYGMSEAAVLRLKATEYERQLQGFEIEEDEQRRLESLLAATNEQIRLQKQLSSMQAEATFWKSLEDTAHSTFVSIMDGSKDAATRLKDTFKNIFFDWLYQQTLKKWIIELSPTVTGGGNGLSSLMSTIGSAYTSSGGVGSSQGILGSASNLLSMGKTLYQGFSAGMAATMGGYITQFGNLFGSQAISAFGTGMGMTTAQASTAAAAYGGTGTAVGGGLSAGASSASVVPVIGWIIAGMMANNSYFKQGWNIDGQTEDISKEFVSSIPKAWLSGGGGLLDGGLGAALMGTGAIATVGINALNSALKKIGLNDQMASLVSGSSLWAKAFGHQKATIEEQGITGTVSASGFDGDAYANVLQKGGWFRSDKRNTVTADLSAEQDASFDQTIMAMIGAVKGFGSAMGLETAAIDGYSKQIKLVLTSDEAKNQEAIAALFGDIGNELSTMLLPTIAQFTVEGETASTTLQRLATDFASVTTIMRAMGVDASKAFGTVGASSIAARERLIALAGGVDALASQTDYFAQNFLTEAERMAPAQKAMAEQLAALGYAGVVTADQFKGAVMDLINGGGLATEAGARTYASLLAIAPQFKVVADYMQQIANADAATALQAQQEAAAKALEIAAQHRTLEIQLMELTGDAAGALAAQRADELAKLDPTNRALQLLIYARQDEAAAVAAQAEALASNEAALRAFVDTAMAAVTRAVAAQKKAVQEVYDAQLAGLQTRIDGVTTVIASLSGLSTMLKSGLSGMTMQGTEEATRANAQAQIEAALAIAKAGGALPSADSLKDAVGLASKTSTDGFGSFLEYQRDFVRTSSALAELAGLADGQLTDSQKQLAALNGQRDDLQDWYTSEIERLDDVLIKAQAQVDAINGVNASVISVAQALGLLAASIAGVKAGPTTGAADSTALTMDQLYQSVLGRAPDAAGAAYWAAIFGDSIDQADIANFVNGAAGELGGRVPGFANGGNHAGGWRVVGERGPELEHTGPSRVYSNSASSDLFAGMQAEIADMKNTMAVGLSRLIGETKRGADAVENMDERGVAQRDETMIA